MVRCHDKGNALPGKWLHGLTLIGTKKCMVDLIVGLPIHSMTISHRGNNANTALIPWSIVKSFDKTLLYRKVYCTICQSMFWKFNSRNPQARSIRTFYLEVCGALRRNSQSLTFILLLKHQLYLVLDTHGNVPLSTHQNSLHYIKLIHLYHINYMEFPLVGIWLTVYS